MKESNRKEVWTRCGALVKTWSTRELRGRGAGGIELWAWVQRWEYEKGLAEYDGARWSFKLEDGARS